MAASNLCLNQAGMKSTKKCFAVICVFIFATALKVSASKNRRLQSRMEMGMGMMTTNGGMMGGNTMINNNGFAISDLMVDSTPVTYQCTMTALWSSVSHPVDYPETARYSPPVFVSHDSGFTVWSAGSQSSAGVQLVAETGDTRTLQSELTAAGEDVSNVVIGTVQWNNNVPDIPVGHIVGRVQNLGGITLDEDHTFLSTITMLAPSPDWFTGFSRFEPVDNGMWLEYFSIDTQPYDAGTDDGATFTSDDAVTSPKGTISEFTVNSPPSSEIFENAAGDGVEPVANWFCMLET